MRTIGSNKEDRRIGMKITNSPRQEETWRGAPESKSTVRSKFCSTRQRTTLNQSHRSNPCHSLARMDTYPRDRRPASQSRSPPSAPDVMSISEEIAKPTNAAADPYRHPQTRIQRRTDCDPPHRFLKRPTQKSRSNDRHPSRRSRNLPTRQTIDGFIAL